ncbi:hypothetical protein ABFX02_08G221600 [Erythranthe guttata]
MTLLSRIVRSCSRNHSGAASAQIFSRFGATTRFSSSIYTRSAPINTPPRPFSEQTMVRYGSSKRFYSSSSRSTSNPKRQLPLYESDVTHNKPWGYFLIPGSVLAGIGGLVLFIRHNDEKRVVLKGKGEKYERSAIKGPIIGGPFSLIDTEGQIVTEKNLIGNWVLLYFGYTSSPDVGPAEVRKMANTIDILESRQNIKVLPVFVTIDPQRDTPSHLRTYIREFDSRIVGLTGPVAAIRQIAQEYRVFFKKIDEQGDDYLVDTSHNMYLINPNMEVERSFGVEYSTDELAEAITKEIKKSKITNSQN